MGFIKKTAIGLTVVFAAAVTAPIALEQTGATFRVPANERQAVTFYGGFGDVSIMGYELANLGYVAKPGLNFRIPYMHDDPVAYQIDQQTVDIEEDSKGRKIATATSDNQLIENVILTLRYSLKEDSIEDIHSNARQYKQILHDLALQVHKEVLGDINISALESTDTDSTSLTQLRDEINLLQTSHMREAVKGTLLEGLVDIQGLQLNDFQFTEEFRTSIDEVSRVKNEITKAQAELERERIVARRLEVEAEGIKKKTVIEAEGRAQATILEGEANAEALRAQVEAMSGAGAEEFNRNVLSNRWGGQYPDTYVVGKGEGNQLILDTRSANDNGSNDITAPIAAPLTPR